MAYTYEQVIDALRKADAAGNTEDAKRLATIAQNLRAQAEAPAMTAGAPYDPFAQEVAAGAPMPDAPTAIDVRAGSFLRGAVKDPIDALRQFVSQEQREKIAAEEEGFQELRQRTGVEGFDLSRLLGGMVSPTNIIAPLKTAQALQAAGRGGLVQSAAAGAVGAALQPVTSASEDPVDFLTQKISQVGVGAAVGGLLYGGIEGVKGGGRLLKELTAPLSEKGRQEILRKYINGLAGNEKQKFVDVLNKADEFVPGSRPTAAEALSGEPGAVNLAAAQQRVSRTEQGAPMFSTRLSEQEAARKAAVQTVGQTEEVLEAAIAARAADATRNYGAAFGQTIRADPELAVLASNPFFRDVLPDAIRLAEARGITAKTDLTQFLQFVKNGLDKQLSRKGDTALSRTEKFEVMNVKERLSKWISEKNPAFKVAREEFAKASEPINQMQIGQYLQNKLGSPLDAERAGAFSNAVRESAATIKRAGGEVRFEKLEQVLTPRQNAAIQSVVKDLQRASKADELARRASVAGIDAAEANIPQLLSRTAAITNAVLRALKSDANVKLNEEMARLMLSPRELATFMSSVPKSRSKDVINAIYPRLTPENRELLNRTLLVEAAELSVFQPQ
jgi:hypothetical protein